MINKIYRILILIQIVVATGLGLITFDLMGAAIGFIAGVLIAGNFLTSLNNRDLTAENTKLLKGILEEIKKNQSMIESRNKELQKSEK